MTDTLQLLALHAAQADAQARSRFAAHIAAQRPPGGVLLETCHRVELLLTNAQEAARLAADAPAGVRRLAGTDAARHVVRLAVGLESAVIAEDQVLHQLRRAMADARARGPLPPTLDRLLDLALRSGRRARTWLPPTQRGLAELALERVLGGAPPSGAVLIVGAGEMARRAARALGRRGISPLLTSRTPERAAALAGEVGARTVPFDPGRADLAAAGGVVIALAGQWSLSADSARALVGGGAWVIDLSAPPAIDRTLADRLGERLTTIDDLAGPGQTALSERMLGRLDELVESTVAEWQDWSARSSERALALALAERASAAQAAELHALWRRAPDLAPAQRAEVERMARHLAERLLREPLEQLADDREGQRARAARELFRL